MVTIYTAICKKEQSHQILLRLLSEVYGVNATEDDLKKTENGKLFLPSSPVKFSVTHSKGNLAVAFSKDEVGVDEEVVSPDRKYRDVFGVSPRSHEEFYALWTKAEALVKYHAGSILMDLRKIRLDDKPSYDGKPLDVNLFTETLGNLVLSVATTESEYEIKKLPFPVE